MDNRPMDFVKLLEHSFETEGLLAECPAGSRLAYLSQHIFDFTTYDGAMDELFGRKALEVCAAINDGKTFDYIKDPEGYQWYLVMCNMPFFADKLEWGTSIRGAWWSHGSMFILETCGLWDGDEQMTDAIAFDTNQWRVFIAALIEFGLGDGSGK